MSNKHLQIAVEPSCLQIENQAGEYQMQISVNITGLSFDTIDNDTEFKGAFEFLQQYHTYLFYNKVRVIFLDYEQDVIEYKDLSVSVNSLTDSSRAFCDYIANEVKVNIQKKEQLIFPFESANDDIKISQEGFDRDGNFVNPGKGYSNMLFANFSQLLPPLNEQAGLVLFAESDVFDIIPEGAVDFVAYPFFQSDSIKPTINIRSIDDKKDLWASDYGATTIPGIDNTMFDHRYISMRTEIPRAEVKKGNINLRDTKGNFDGSVEIDVFQELDWTRDYNTNIGSNFRFQVLLQDFLTQQTSVALIVNDTAKFQLIIESLEGLLWRLTLEPFFPYLMALPTGHVYFGVKQKEITKERYANWVDSIKGSSQLKDLIYELKLMLLTQIAEDGITRVIKKEYQPIWKISETEVPETNLVIPIITETTGIKYKTGWVNKWSECWANIIEASRQITDQEKQKQDQVAGIATELTGDKLLKMTLIFINANNPFNNDLNFEEISYMASRYEQAIYLDSYQTSALNSISSFLEKLTDLIPGFWKNVKSNSHSLLTALFPQQEPDILKTEFESYLVESVKGLKDKITKAKDALHNPPPIRVKVQPNTWIHSGTDDISDEIAGFLLLNQRGTYQHDSNTFDDTWHHLNITKPNIDANGINIPLESDPTQQESASLFLRPAFLSEMEDVPLLSLSLSNEKRSISELELTLYYTPEDKVPREATNTFPQYSADFTSPEYWYGYFYRFAGFVALNSGALPPALRHNNKLNIFNRNPGLVVDDKLKTYHHCRKVALTTPNISPKIDARTRRFEHKDPPGDFQPLAKELSFWQDRAYTHYTLSESVHFNKQIVFNVAKATTSIWDWFASEKKTLKELLNYTGTDRLLQSVKEFLNRRTHENAKYNGPELPDPLADDLIFVEWCIVHPFTQSRESFTIDSKDLPSFTVCWGGDKATGYKAETNTITVKKGEIIEVIFWTLVDKKHFETATRMIDDILQPEDITENTFNNYYKLAPKSFCFEAARHPQKDLPDLAKEIWELIMVSDSEASGKPAEEKEYVQVLAYNKQLSADPNRDVINYISDEFAYVKDLEVKHQRWNWDGRLDLSGKEEYFREMEDLDPKYPDYGTTNAMKWEAWSFSNRPDNTGSTYHAQLKVESSTITGKKELQIAKQLLCSVENKGETKALYHRFSITAYSRYKFLDKIANDITTSVPILGYVRVDNLTANGNIYKNQWKRFLQLSRRKEALPTPVVRFFIPLTESINPEQATAKHENAGAIMAVLDGNGFDEGGLAYGLEIGIDKVSYLNDEKETITYLNFGTSPTHSINGSKPVVATTNSSNVTEYLTFIPQGPVGFTFDTGAENPKITSSAVFLDLADKNLSEAVHTINGEHQAWSLMRIAIRSFIRKRFHKHESLANELTSKWSDKSWIEFIQAANFFIPLEWINAVNRYGFIELRTSDFTKLPVFDDLYEETIVRYVIITKTESDIGGVLVESYFGTYHYNKDNNKLTNVHGESLTGNFDGFVRILVASKDRDEPISENDNIWTLLFPNSGNKIQDDTKMARPLITRRIPMKILFF